MKKEGSNFIPLVLDTRLLIAVNKKASEKEQLNGTYLLSVIVENCKDVLSQEAYEELKGKYSISAEEQIRLKRQKQRDKIEQKRRELDLRERELALKEQNAKVFQKQTEISVDKRKEQRRNEIQKRLRQLKGQVRQIESRDLSYATPEKTEEMLNKFNEEIRTLEKELK